MLLEKESNNRFCWRMRGAIQTAEKPGTKREIPPLSVQTGCPYGAAAWRLDGENHPPHLCQDAMSWKNERAFHPGWGKIHFLITSV